jgi:hypothetical protein
MRTLTHKIPYRPVQGDNCIQGRSHRHGESWSRRWVPHENRHPHRGYADGASRPPQLVAAPGRAAHRALQLGTRHSYRFVERGRLGRIAARGRPWRGHGPIGSVDREHRLRHRQQPGQRCPFSSGNYASRLPRSRHATESLNTDVQGESRRYRSGAQWFGIGDLQTCELHPICKVDYLISIDESELLSQSPR